MTKITFLAGQGCLPSNISGLMDAFAIANLWHQAMEKGAGPLFETEIVSADGQPITGDGCMQIHPHCGFDGFKGTDFLLIPAFLPVAEPMTADIDMVLAWIAQQYRNGTPVAAMCTGVFLLAETGLLDGKAATTNWQFAKRFGRRYPRVRLQAEQILTEDTGLICSGAVTSIFNLGIHIIRRFGNAELATVCSKALLVDPNRSSQTPYFIHRGSKAHRDEDILKAQRYLESNYATGVAIDEVARHVCISPRHFKRRFRQATGENPLSYLQKVRIEAAKKLLETTRDKINEITWRIGYEDSSTFRRLFKKHTDLSPREYRDKFLQCNED